MSLFETVKDAIKHFRESEARKVVFRGFTGSMRNVSPARLILFSFAGAIVIGAFFLTLPISAAEGRLSLVDALFTSTSAVCVTGLIVVDTEKHLSMFGQGVVLLLIQMGGLGIMTYSTFFLFVFKRRYISQKGVQLLRETLSSGTPDVRKLMSAVFKVTIAFELWGFLLLYLVWNDVPGRPSIIWDCAFHSVSAFCNAGFSTFSQNLYKLRQIQSGVIIIMFLIILGGFGFSVLESMLYRREFKKVGMRSFPLQSKVVLATSGILILGGTILFWMLDAGTSNPQDGFFLTGFHALFQSVTARTAGFNTVHISQVTHLGLVLLMGLMFIGGSPGSTAGGIKTTTAAILFATLLGHLKHPEQPDVEIFKRRIPTGIVSRAFIILILALMAIISVTVILTVTERGRAGMWPPGQEKNFRLLFETISAFGTVGLSTGITPFLSIPGKLLITVTMFIGRLGPLTIGLALIQKKKRPLYRYPEEKIMVG